MIRKAAPNDLSQIKGLTEACALALQKRGVFQWNENYPSREKLSLDIEHRELYVLEKEESIVGIVMLTTRMDEVYKKVHWLTPEFRHLYIHRLAITPAQWGKSYGKAMMDFAEDLAAGENCRSIRLDTFSQNKRNQVFYRRLGYQRLEDIFYPFKSAHPFHCYEKVLPQYG